LELWRVDPNSLQFSEPLVAIEARRDFIGVRVNHEKPWGVVRMGRNTFLGLNSPENVFAGVAEFSDVGSGNIFSALCSRLYETGLGAAREEDRVSIWQRFALAAADEKRRYQNVRREVALRLRHRNRAYCKGLTERPRSAARDPGIIHTDRFYRESAALRC